MYKCLNSSIFTMTCSVYEQQISQDEQSNEIVRSWNSLKNIVCAVFAVKETGASVMSDNKTFSKDYKETLEIKMNSLERLSKRWRISNIKGPGRESLYVEMDDPSEPDTIFEVYSSHPVFDAFGYVQYYENHLRRVEVQDNDKNANYQTI